MIAGGNNNRVLEVTPAGKVVWSIDQKELPGITLAECVSSLAKLKLVAEPGTRFDYGNTHLHVAARMAEVSDPTRIIYPPE